MPARDVVSSDQAGSTPSPGDQPTPAVRRFKFVKNQNPDERVVLSNGTQIKFHRPTRPGGYKEGFGTFETKDEKVAGLLRTFMGANPGFYIFEQKQKE